MCPECFVNGLPSFLRPVAVSCFALVQGALCGWCRARGHRWQPGVALVPPRYDRLVLVESCACCGAERDAQERPL